LGWKLELGAVKFVEGFMNKVLGELEVALYQANRTAGVPPAWQMTERDEQDEDDDAGGGGGEMGSIAIDKIPRYP